MTGLVHNLQAAIKTETLDDMGSFKSPTFQKDVPSAATCDETTFLKRDIGLRSCRWSEM